MRFSESVLHCLGHFCDVTGRAGRREFWWFLLFCMLCWTALTALGALFPGQSWASLFLAALLLPSLISAAVRRLHDIGYEGFWISLILFPVVGQIALAVLLARMGENARNRFGRNPRYWLLFRNS